MDLRPRQNVGSAVSAFLPAAATCHGYATEVLAAAPKLFYKMNDNKVGTDSSGNGSTMTTLSAAVATGAPLWSGSTGSYTFAAAYGAPDATKHYCTRAYASWMATPTLAFTMVYKAPSSTIAYRPIVSRDVTMTLANRGFTIYNNNQKFNVTGTDFGSALTAGTVYHLAFNWSTARLDAWVNGALWATLNVPDTALQITSWAGNGNLYIGGTDAGTATAPYWTGNMGLSDLAVYDRLLTTAEIGAQYAAYAAGRA